MNNIQLIKFAAKAGRIEGRFIERMPEDGHPRYSCGIGNESSTHLWNPLSVYGDALKLSVDLGIGIRHHQGWGEVFHPSVGEISFNYGDNAVLATCRAITTLAAEIGMK